MDGALGVQQEQSAPSLPARSVKKAAAAGDAHE
jgi:hypothetical protein